MFKFGYYILHLYFWGKNYEEKDSNIVSVFDASDFVSGCFSNNKCKS